MADDKELEKKEALEEAKAEEVKEEAKAEEVEETKAEETKAEEVEETPAEEAKTEEVAEETPAEEAVAEEAKAEKKQAIGGPKSKKKKAESTYSEEEENVEEAKAEEEKVEEAPKSNKDLVEAKIRKQIEKKQQKEASLGVYRIGEYLKEEHQWENWLFLGISIITLLLGCLMLNGALQVRSDFPVIGEYPTVFAWILVVLASLGLLYALYPFLKPAFPELKKITWLTWPKFLGNAIRTFVFIIILTLLFMLYDVFITELLGLII
jgi:preprotein translocase subunit SecE